MGLRFYKKWKEIRYKADLKVSATPQEIFEVGKLFTRDHSSISESEYKNLTPELMYHFKPIYINMQEFNIRWE